MSWAKFRKRPVVIDAWDGSADTFAAVKALAGGREVRTPIGGLFVQKGSRLDHPRVCGELYPCKPDIFEATEARYEGAE